MAAERSEAATESAGRRFSNNTTIYVPIHPSHTCTSFLFSPTLTNNPNAHVARDYEGGLTWHAFACIDKELSVNLSNVTVTYAQVVN